MMVKASKYQLLLTKVKALIEKEVGLIANLANTTAAIQEEFKFLWVGFYRVKKGNEMWLGPFQGPVACTRIAKGRGVCGTSWEKDEVIIVKDVHEFPDHIACSAETNSEIVLPVHDRDGKVALVLDIDSIELGTFDEIDAQYLGEIVKEIEKLL